MAAHWNLWKTFRVLIKKEPAYPNLGTGTVMKRWSVAGVRSRQAQIDARNLWKDGRAEVWTTGAALNWGRTLTITSSTWGRGLILKCECLARRQMEQTVALTSWKIENNNNALSIFFFFLIMHFPFCMPTYSCVSLSSDNLPGVGWSLNSSFTYRPLSWNCSISWAFHPWMSVLSLPQSFGGKTGLCHVRVTTKAFELTLGRYPG